MSFEYSFFLLETSIRKELSSANERILVLENAIELLSTSPLPFISY